MIPRIHSVALAFLFAATLPGPAQAPTGGTQLLNPSPQDCCTCITTKVNMDEIEHEPDEDPSRIYPETNGTFLVPLDVKVNASYLPNYSCDGVKPDKSDEVKITKIVLRSKSEPTSGSATVVVVAYEAQGNEPTKGVKSFVQTVPLPGSKVAESKTQDWEVYVTCSNNTQVAPGAAVAPFGSCSYPFQLGGCMSCLVCQVSASNNGSGASMSIPVGSANAGDSAGSVRFQSKGTANPGPAGITAFVPSNFTVARDANGAVTFILTPVNTIEVSAAPTAFDPNAFTITHKHTATNAVFRTTTMARVQEGGATWLRSDSTFDGTTFRYQQKKDQNAGVTTWTMESGPVTGGTYTVQRKEILQTSEPQPGTRIHRKTTQELDSSTSSFVTLSDTATTWNKFAWGWEKTQQVVDPDGANLVNNWTYYQPGELSGPNSAEGLGRVHTHTRYDGWQEVHTYWLNHHQVQQPFADQPQGLTILSQYDPATRTTTTTKTVGGSTLSQESESYNPATNTRVSKAYTSGGSALTTTTILMPYGQDFGGSPFVVTHPDGTLTTYAHTRHSDGGKTTVTSVGAGSGGVVTKGRKTTTTTNRYGTTIRSVTETIGYPTNIVTGHSAVTSVDAFGRKLATAYFPSASSAPDGAVQATVSGAKWSTYTSYNCCGVTSQIDQHGIETTYAYDSLRRQKSTTTLGVTTETVRHGLTTDTYRYPAGGSAAAGNLVSRSSNNFTNTQSSSWSPDPSSTTAGALVETTTATSHAGGITTTVTTVPGGASQTSQSYSDGRSWKTTGDLSPGMIHSYAVNTTGLLTTSSYLDGTTPVETATTQTDWAGRTLATAKGPQVTSQAYNTLGQHISLIDADGVRTLSAYNDLGEQTITTIDTNGNGTIDFDGTDRITVSTSEPGTYASTPVLTSTSSVYATNGSGTATVVSTSHATPDGLGSWSISPGVVNPSHSVSTIGTGGAWTETTTNPDGTSTKNTYTGGRLEKTESFTNDITPALVTGTSFVYDSLGRPWKSTDARTGTIETAYVSATCDSVISTTDPGSRTTSYTYSANGHRLTTTLPDNSVSYASYYPSGEVSSTWGSQTYPVYYAYDHAGRKLTMRTKPTLDTNGVPTNDGASLTIWNYSPVTGLLESKLDANNQGPSYTYTNAGRMLTRTWARPISATDATKVKTTYGYASGLLTTVTYNDGTPNLEYTYTRFGAQDTVKRGGVLHADYDYDNTILALATEKLNQDTAIARTLNHYTDALGRPLSLELSGEYTTAYGYDDASRLNRVWHHPVLDPNKSPTGSADFTYAYAPNSSLIASVTGPVHTVTNTWESTRDALDFKENKVGTTVVSRYDYGVNNLGQRTGVQQAGTAFAATRGISWGYDSFGQIISSDSTNNPDDRAYQFDAIGNRLFSEASSTQISNPPTANTTAYTPNAINQYTAVASFTPSYDLDGNQVNAQILPLGSSNLVSRVFRWDAENRLIEVRDSSGNVLVTNDYDHLSRLISRSAVGTTTHYLYDGWNRIGEFSGTTLQKTYTWGLDPSNSMQGAGGIDGLLAEKQGASSFYPTYDGNGNVSEYLDSAGAIAVHFEYDPFGNTMVNTDTTGQFAYRFSTKPIDAATGLYYYGYRFYDPLTGRWPSRDPIEEEGGVNLYGFLDNNAISRIDELGMWFTDGRSVPDTNARLDNVEATGTIYVKANSTEAYGSFISTTHIGAKGGARYNAAEYHENKHIAQLKLSKDKDAISYRQVLCIEENKKTKFIYYQAEAALNYSKSVGNVVEVEYVKGKDSTTKWGGTPWIMYSTGEERIAAETEAFTLEINALKGLEEPYNQKYYPGKDQKTIMRILGPKIVKDRILDLTQKQGKLKIETQLGLDKNFGVFIGAYTKKIKEVLDTGGSVSWLEPDHVYSELLAIPLHK